jgi:hypothetical protein
VASSLGFSGLSLRCARGGLVWPGGFILRTLFDNFIGRKRDVDGGVLAGSLRKQGTGRDKLTVTFQTTILFGVGFGERRETDVELIASDGSVFGTRHMSLGSRETEGFAARRLFGRMTGQ